VKIYHDINNFKGRKPIVTIGTFDGVHRGHQLVIKRLRDIAMEQRGESVLLTFLPHPRLITSSNGTSIRLLTTLEEKKILFEKSGIDNLIVVPFTKSFSELQYSEFVENILIGKINMYYLVIGYDHRFGKNRKGGFEYLQDCAKQYHFKIEKIEPLKVDNTHISSTQIRKALEEGLISKANNYLGYKYTLHGRVIAGRKIGREIGFPTANIEASDVNKLIPGYGVYAVEIIISGKKYKGMLNIGSRPTFNKNADKRSIEVHVFNFTGDLYNKKITLLFADKIRDEKKFSSAQALTEQLKKDKTTALKILSRF
jgi:riboflavin kinase / FMN adenylyltransferase